jgi:hypothetical protein
VYEIIFDLYYLKGGTAGATTFNITNTQTYTNLVAYQITDQAGGLAATSAAQFGGGIVGVTTAAAALPALSSQTLNTNHHTLIRALAEINTAGNIRLRATSAGSGITALRGSMYTVRRLYAGNVGSFVA